jgi:hypothetical protein
MRRVLFAFVVLALLAVPASAIAVEPEQEIAAGEVYLGELILISVGGYEAGEPVDAYLYRPSTLAGWPLTNQAPILNADGVASWLIAPASEQRRWSYAETAGTPVAVADEFGIWGAILMIPRDEVWFPCSFPLKWQCNFLVDEENDLWEVHSPQRVNYIGFPVGMDYWPWTEIFGAAGDPADVISPLEVDVFNYGPIVHGPQFEAVVTGYDWKWSDIDW